jgi:hypothetical protein
MTNGNRNPNNTKRRLAKLGKRLDKQWSELEEMLDSIDSKLDSVDEVSEHTNSLLIQLMDYVGVPDPTRGDKMPVPKSAQSFQPGAAPIPFPVKYCR